MRRKAAGRTDACECPLFNYPDPTTSQIRISAEDVMAAFRQHAVDKAKATPNPDFWRWKLQLISRYRYLQWSLHRSLKAAISHFRISSTARYWLSLLGGNEFA